MKQNNTDITVKDLIKKYTDAISIRQEHIDFYQRQIETEKAKINSFKEKVKVLTDVFEDVNLNTEQNKFKLFSNVNRGEDKWGGLCTLTSDMVRSLTTKDLVAIKTEDLKFSDLSPKGQYNKCTTPIKPLTSEQLASFEETKKTIKSLKDALEKHGNTSLFLDIQYNTDSTWPTDLW